MKTNRPTFRSDEHLGASPDVSAQNPFKGSDPYRHVAVAYYPGEEVIPIGIRVGRNQLEKYSEELTRRDREILASLKKCKFLLTGQIQRLHITNASTQKAARRAAARELRKLKDYGLVNTLELWKMPYLRLPKRRSQATHFVRCMLGQILNAYSELPF